MMTNSEAINWIKRFELAFPLPVESYIDAKEALDCAIKALDKQMNLCNNLRELLEDIERYENDCNLTADSVCKKCNDTMFGEIRGFIEDHFGGVMKDGT